MEEEEEEEQDKDKDKDKEKVKEVAASPPPLSDASQTQDVDDAVPAHSDDVDVVTEDPLKLTEPPPIDRLKEGEAEEPEERDEVDGQMILSFTCAEELEDFSARQNSGSSASTPLARTGSFRQTKGISFKKKKKILRIPQGSNQSEWDGILEEFRTDVVG